MAFDGALEKLGDSCKGDVLAYLEGNRVYHQNADFIEVTKVAKALADLFGPDVSWLLLEWTLLEMDRLRSIQKLG